MTFINKFITFLTTQIDEFLRRPAVGSLPFNLF